MDEKVLRGVLRDLPLGGLRYFPTVSSTNDEALAWAAQGADDLSLVIADEQTAGRGREGRKWFTPPGSALAFSLLMRPTEQERPHLSRVVGLAALSVADVLRSYSLPIQVKWPNDVLVGGRKLAGILIESVWNGEAVDCTVIGIGLNVMRPSVPPKEMLNFPATSLEDVMGETIPPRESILRDILAAFIAGRPRLTSDDLIADWEESLAYRGDKVEVSKRGGEKISGRVVGLASDGSLLLDDRRGKRVTVRFGDVRLRPAEG
jgi:BirA family biotin operon repressor/biotin-[acetyl-CoA-carboxylase] ligase